MNREQRGSSKNYTDKHIWVTGTPYFQCLSGSKAFSILLFLKFKEPNIPPKITKNFPYSKRAYNLKRYGRNTSKQPLDWLVYDLIRQLQPEVLLSSLGWLIEPDVAVKVRLQAFQAAMQEDIAMGCIGTKKVHLDCCCNGSGVGAGGRAMYWHC